MDWEKIKSLLLTYKKYLFGAAILLLLVGLWQEQTNNESELKEEAKTSTVAKKSDAEEGKTAANSSEVTCDISGAVKNQGVYTLKNGARLGDLISAAGGLRHNAQLKAINQALLLKDQDKVHIPYKGEKVEAATSATGTATTASNNQEQGEKVNINTADKQELQKLTGIGEKKAEQIIAYRQQKGSFKKIEELKEVSGIGDKTFAAFKDQLTI